MRWILVDQFTHIEKGQSARGVRAFTRSEAAVSDLYPCYPVMPPTLILEMMAQVGGILVGSTIDFGKEVVLAKITDAEFSAAVTPPALFEIETTHVAPAILTEQELPLRIWKDASDSHGGYSVRSESL
jgi:3-hydroxyacyl-[acyl-carrier-protein] dehydratase